MIYLRWLFGKNKIILNSPYDFFFFSLQQHFIAEDYLLVCMRDNYYMKKKIFYTWVSEFLQIISNYFFPYTIVGITMHIEINGF